MRFIIYGSGAIGSVIGGHLFRQGYHVVLVGNAQHVDAINENGLKLVTGAETFMLNVPAVKTAQELAPFTEGDIVLLCAKSQQTVNCLGQLKNAGAPRTMPVFCFQNSIVNESVATRMFDKVYGVMVMLPALFITPGEVVNPILSPYGVIEMGCYPRGRDPLSEQLAAALNASGFCANVHPEVMKSKAAKCLINLGNALDAITDGKSEGHPYTREARREAMEVWSAAGIEWESVESLLKRVRSISGKRKNPVGYEDVANRSSSWQSLARGTGNIEAEQLNGDVVMLGRQLRIATPYNEKLWLCAEEVAHNGEKPGRYSADELLSTVRRQLLPAGEERDLRESIF